MPVKGEAMKVALASCKELPGWEVDDRPLHEALAALGAEVTTPPWDDSDFPWEDQDAVLIRTTWDYWDRREAFVSWAMETAGKTRLYNRANVIQWNTDKTYLRELEQLGVRIAPTVWLNNDSARDVGALMAENGWNRGFLKPVVGAAASDTLRFRDDSEGIDSANAHLEETLPRVSMMLQPYLAQVETFGEVSFLFFGGEFSHSVQKIPIYGDYRVQDDFGAKDMPYEASDEEISMAMHTLTAASKACPGQNGDSFLYARVDYLKDDEGNWILTELELVEPSLFFRHTERGAEMLAKTLYDWLKS